MKGEREDMDIKVTERLEELVQKIDYNGHRATIPEEWIKELNDLTGNDWPEEGYKEYCVEYNCTLEETVYALLHEGRYPDWVENELHFIRPLDKSVVPTRKVRHMLCVCDINDDIRKEFEELPVIEIEKWFTDYFAGWKKEVSMKEDRVTLGGYEYGKTSLFFEFSGEREYGYEKYIGVSMSNYKVGFIWSKNLSPKEWDDVINFFENSSDYTFLED